MNVLIVDDHADNRSLLQAMFKPLGHCVISATNGENALKAMRGNKIDLVIADILMPVMDGFRLCMEIKKDEEFKQIPFIFYTATYTDKEDESLALSLGADRFIRKPMDPEAFLGVISEVLQEAQEGKIQPKEQVINEKESLKGYSHRLAKKLDKKVRELHKELAARMEAEKRLKQANRYLESIFENANVWFNVLDDEAHVVMWNKAAEQISGYAAKEVTGHGRIWEWLYPDKTYRDEIYAKAEAIIQKGLIAEDFETVIRRKDGEGRVISWYSRDLKDEQGNSIGSVALGRDVTRRNKAEREVKEMARRYQQLFDANADALYVLDKDGRFLDANAAAVRRYQYSREELLGMTARDLATANLKDRAADRIKQSMIDGTPFEWRHQRRDGMEFPVEIAPSPLDLANGQKAILSAVRDISERKRIEEEREQLQRQLTQAQKLESVGRLAGGVAHDYNNLLSVIIGYAELALEKVDSADPLHGDLKEIAMAADRAKRVTQQLLAFARKQIVAPKVMELNTSVEGMLQMLRRLIGEDIDLIWHPATALWPVKIDPSQIDQILANLCVNARDAITGVGKLTIETHNVTFDQSYCADHAGFIPGEFAMLAVSDNGCGMDKETLVHVFEPFFTTKGVEKGTGLGLATVYGIVKQNNGFINVYSETGQGTSIKIYLPRQEGLLDDTDGKKEVIVPTGMGETILIVEDDVAVLALTDKILQRLGYAVLPVKTCNEAIGLAIQHAGRIDLLVTDVVMPGMNGRELANQIQTFCPNIKTLFMSGYTADVIAHHGVLDEGVKFVQKPFSGPDLATAVRNAIDNDH